MGVKYLSRCLSSKLVELSLGVLVPYAESNRIDNAGLEHLSKMNLSNLTRLNLGTFRLS